MNVYLITGLFIIGLLSRLSYGDALQSVQNMGFAYKDYEILTEEKVKKNYLGSIIGFLLLIVALIFAFKYYLKWSTLLYLVASVIISILIFRIFKAILGGYLSRIIFIWVLPIIGFLYLISLYN